MNLKDDAFYSINEVLNFVTWNKRKLQRYASKNNIRKIDKRYLFTGLDIRKIQKINDNDATKKNKVTTNKTISTRIINLIHEIDNEEYIISLLTAIKEDKHIEEMSEEEYLLFIDKIKEANLLAERVEEYKNEISRMESYVEDYRNNIAYFKKSLDKRQEETELLLKSLNQRNYIEAKREGFDT